MAINLKYLLEYAKRIYEEHDDKHMVVAFGRFNPPTTGHEKLVNKVVETAKNLDADHEIILSHSNDPVKNPLTPEQKLKHAQRFFPNANISVASKKQPTIISYLQKINETHDKATLVAGGDRVEEFHNLVHKYNNKPNKKGDILFNFKEINVISAGDRDPDSEDIEGMSASKMRSHVKNDNFDGFRQGVPKHVSDAHAKEMYNDVRNGMGIK